MHKEDNLRSHVPFLTCIPPSVRSRCGDKRRKPVVHSENVYDQLATMSSLRVDHICSGQQKWWNVQSDEEVRTITDCPPALHKRHRSSSWKNCGDVTEGFAEGNAVGRTGFSRPRPVLTGHGAEPADTDVDK